MGPAGSDSKPADSSFLGADGEPLIFGADGVQVRRASLLPGLPSFVTVGTVHVMNTVIHTSAPAANIGFGDDGLYVGSVPVKECK